LRAGIDVIVVIHGFAALGKSIHRNGRNGELTTKGTKGKGKEVQGASLPSHLTKPENRFVQPSVGYPLLYCESYLTSQSARLVVS
jgi:hypothetical protein